MDKLASSLSRIGRSTSRAGFSTLEILIAMVIITLTFSAVILVSFGNQTILIDSQANVEALSKAQALLENAQALSRKDFDLVTPTSTVETSGSLTYQKKLEVEQQSDLFSKKITATVSWPGEHGRMLNVKISGLVTNFVNAVGGSTCDSALTGDWAHPSIKNATTNFSQLVGDAGSAYTITDVDAYQGKLYVTVNNSSLNKETFFVFNISNPANPTLISKIDNDPDNNTGINAVRIGGRYAYVANASSFVKGQMQILDIGVTPPQIIKLVKIATSTVSGNSTQGIGNSIFYKDGYLYLGLTKPASGPEFNIIDVHSTTSPAWLGGYTMGNTINALLVRGQYAYVATPNAQELKVLDIGNLILPASAGGSGTTAGSGNGKSIAVVGDRLYLGRTLGGSEFSILDNTTPASTLSEIDSGDAGASESINGLLVRDYLAFLLTSHQLQMRRVDTLPSTSYGVAVNLPGTSVGTAMDCEGNYIYIASNDIGGNGFLSVVAP